MQLSMILIVINHITLSVLITLISLSLEVLAFAILFTTLINPILMRNLANLIDCFFFVLNNVLCK